MLLRSAFDIFNKTWMTWKYLITEVRGKTVCLVCGKTFLPGAFHIHVPQLSLHKWYAGVSAESESWTKKRGEKKTTITNTSTFMWTSHPYWGPLLFQIHPLKTLSYYYFHCRNLYNGNYLCTWAPKKLWGVDGHYPTQTKSTHFRVIQERFSETLIEFQGFTSC